MNFTRPHLRSRDLVITRSRATRNLLLSFTRSNLHRLVAFAGHGLVRRGELQSACSCVAQASACVPCFRRGGVYPARRRGAPSVHFAGMSRLSFRQGTASYPEARRAAVPKEFENSGVLTPEVATRWLRPRLSANLSSRGAMRRGICFSLPLFRSTQPSSKNHSLRDTND